MYIAEVTARKIAEAIMDEIEKDGALNTETIARGIMKGAAVLALQGPAAMPPCVELAHKSAASIATPQVPIAPRYHSIFSHTDGWHQLTT